MSTIDLERSNVSDSSPLALRPRPLSRHHQELKFTLHRKLLDKINLDALEMC